MKNETPLFVVVLLILGLASSCNFKKKRIPPPTLEPYSNRSWQEVRSYPLDYGRTDDLFFFSPERGFVVNSEGYLLLTEDGGQHWETKFRREETFFRCLTFRDSLNGFLGTIGVEEPLLYSADSISMYQTADGGESWTPTKFNGPYPKGLCGLQTVSDSVIVGCGRVRGPSFFIRSTDGGKTWNSYDYNHLAGSLIAPYFYDDNHGLLIGGTTNDKKNCHSLVLETFDGGVNWDTIYVSANPGEYCWKVAFPSDSLGFISIQKNIQEGPCYVLQTKDGGKNWFVNEYVDDYYYVQGIGFLNEQIGWMGGTQKWTMETTDGGVSWNKVANVGSGFNNFQFFGDSIGYGVGFGVFRMGKGKER